MTVNHQTATVAKQAPSAARRVDATTNASELAAIARTVSRYKSDPRALRQAMQKAGILTETGELAKDYRS